MVTERPQLVLNHRNPLTRRITALSEQRLIEPAAEGFTAVGRPEAASAAIELRDQIRDEAHGGDL